MRKIFTVCVMLLMCLCAGCAQNSRPAETIAETAATVPEQIEVLNEVIATVNWAKPERRVFRVGKDVTINKQGLITEIVEMYKTLQMRYDNEGRLLEIAEIDKDDGSTGYNRWVYDNAGLVSGGYNPNDGFRSSSESKFELEKDNDGRIIAINEKCVYTDAENGKKTTKAYRYEYIYASDGKVKQMTCYADGKADYTAKATYNSEGKIVKYAHYSELDESKGKEYLVLEFTYHMVDKDNFESFAQGAFDYYYNHASLMGIV